MISSYFVHLMARRVYSALYERPCSHTESPDLPFVSHLFTSQCFVLSAHSLLSPPSLSFGPALCYTTVFAATLPFTALFKLLRAIKRSWAQQIPSLALLKRCLSSHWKHSSDLPHRRRFSSLVEIIHTCRWSWLIPLPRRYLGLREVNSPQANTINLHR